MSNKKIILDVLEKFYSVNLASETARGWIAEEISKKLENENHEVSEPSFVKNVEMSPNDRGAFEQYLSKIDEINENNEKSYNEQIENQQKVVAESNAVKSKPKKPKKTVKRNAGTSKSSKTFKNLKKPRGKFL